MKLYSKLFFYSLSVGFLVLTCALAGFGAASDVDLSFDAHASKDLVYTGGFFSGSVLVQPDGKILIYGNFRVVNGKAVTRPVRLNADGSIDASFNCPECNKFYISSALLQP